MDYSELISDARRARELGDSELELALLRKADSISQNKGTIADPVAQGLTLGFSDELSGLLGAIPAAVSTGVSIPEAYRGIRDVARERYAGYQAENPKVSLAAELAGGLMTGAAGGGRAMAGTAGRQMLGRAAASGAAIGAASGAGYSEADTIRGLLGDTALGGAVGGAAGIAFPAAGQVIGKIGQKTASIADDLGMRLTPGHRYDSPMLKKIEASMESFAPTSPGFSAVRKYNQQAINRAAAEAIGESGDSLGGDVLGMAHARIGDEFKRLTQGQTIPIDQSFIDELQAIRQSIDTPLKGAKKANRVLDAVEKIIASGAIDDKAYQDISSEVADDMMSKSTKGISKSALSKLKESLDNAYERALGSDDLAAFRKARSQWRNLANIVESRSVNESGDVSGLKLANRLASKDKYGYVYGHNKTPLYQAARAAQQYKDIVGNSGTAERLLVPMAANALLGAAGGATTGTDPITGAAVGLLAGPALSRMYVAGGRPISGAMLNRIGASPAALAGLLASDR